MPGLPTEMLLNSTKMEKMTSTSSRRFASQWDENTTPQGQVFTEPSQTVPDQSLTIPQIIARFTRSGLVPATVRMNDQGGNVAADPESDPLDDFSEIQAAAKAANAAPAPADPEPEPAPAPAGA